MIDADISFSPRELVLKAEDRRLAPLAGLGLAALTSVGLWSLLAIAVSRLF